MEINGPGVYAGIPNDVYHAGPGISKSGLWTIYSQTPAHYRYPPEKETKKHFEFGNAVDLAILEANNFEAKVMRGPEDRRGNKWKDAEAEAINTKRHLLTAKEFNDCLTIRDNVFANAFAQSVLQGGDRDTNQNQLSAYVIDPQTGLLIKCRPDKVRYDLNIGIDLKTCRSAAPRQFASAVAEYGYHVQEAHYGYTWALITGKPWDGYLFFTCEKESPFAFKVYELSPSSVAEGEAIRRQAMETYDTCMRTDTWPAYGDDVSELSIPRWAFKLTPFTGEED